MKLTFINVFQGNLADILKAAIAKKNFRDHITAIRGRDF